MDGRERDPLSGEPLDREIAVLLAVDASPEFVARVRERVSAEPIGRGWGWSWSPAWVSVAVLGVVLVAGAGLWTRGAVDRGPSTRAAADPSGSRAPTVPPAQVPAASRSVAVAAPASVAVAARRRESAAGTSTRVRTADVQISPDDAIALRQLVDVINARRLDESAVPDLDAHATALPALEEIVVDRIALSPLVALDAQ